MSLILFIFLLSSTFSQLPDVPRIPFANPEGHPNPSPEWQRYRRNETLSSENFFQWWFFWIRHPKTNMHFTVTYALSVCSKTQSPCDYEGSYIGLTLHNSTQLVNGTIQRKKLEKVMKFPFSDYHNLDPSGFHIQIGKNFELLPLDADHYHLRGKVDSETMGSNVLFYEGCDKDLSFEWDFVIERQYGWYGEGFVEIFVGLDEIIEWNPYGHTSFVQEEKGSSAGYLKVGNNPKQILGEDVHAYCDQNWGTKMPQIHPGTKDPMKYSWGWFYAAEKKSGFGAIIGSGVVYSEGFFRDCDAVFADIHMNSSYALRLRQVWAREDSPHSEFGGWSSTDDEWYPMLITRNKTNWVAIKDKFGVGQLPLVQSLHIDTKDWEIDVVFSSTLDDYIRLPFPHVDAVFSDFEGLGVSGSFRMRDKTNGNVRVIVDTAAGVEYGHQFSFSPNRRRH